MDKEQLTHEKIQDEIAKLIAQTSKINSGNSYYTVIITATVILAIIAIVKLFL